MDANVHLVPPAGGRYRRSGVWRSDWPPGNALSVEDYRRRMSRSGIDKAVLVTAIREHGFDNSYTYDSWRRQPDDFVWVGNVDVSEPGVVSSLRDLVDVRGMAGARLVVGGHEDPTGWLGDDGASAVLRAVEELGVPTSLQKFSMGTVGALVRAARRYPGIPFVLYSLGNPTFAAGAWADELRRLAQVAQQENVTVVLSPQNVAAIEAVPAGAARDTVLRQVADLFAPDRLVWGSFSSFRGARAGADGKDLAELVADVGRLFSFLGEQDVGMVLGGAATRLYPALTR